ncbi:MAG: hypothetical protein DMG32_07760 [Acidobacteria bacterium]|nr:MAG: hypothetical protein DMG32_07760 [Acidobacteriota bacterium]
MKLSPLVCPVVALFVFPAWAQQSPLGNAGSGTAQRDPQAINVLSQALVVAGGTAPINSECGDIADPSGPETIAPQQAVTESNEKPMAFLPERLVPEPASPLSGGPDVRAVFATVSTSPIIINSPQRRIFPDHRTHRMWLGLSIAQHSGAAFDAWTTRRALSQYNARELDPLLRPVAGNASLYAAVQIGPTIFDFLSHHMMTSKHEWIRRHWWILQAASTAGSFGSGALNLSRHRGRRAVAGT